jgi:hypothetical protein
MINSGAMSSALPPKAVMCGALAHVGYGPEAEKSQPGVIV